MNHNQHATRNARAALIPSRTTSENLEMQVESATHGAGSGNGGDARPKPGTPRSEGMMPRIGRVTYRVYSRSFIVGSVRKAARCSERVTSPYLW
jgi:hypothetical protein